MTDEPRLNPLVSQVVLAVLRHQGFEVPLTVVPPDLRSSVARKQHYALLEYAEQALAPVGVVRIGKVFTTLLEDMPNPLILVLLNQDSVDGFLEQVARLNRFLHSAHRHEVLERADGLVRLRHVSLSEERPKALESRFVFGLYLGFLEELGCQNLQGSLGSEDASVYDAGAFIPPPAKVEAERWRFRWSRFQPTRKPLPGLEGILLQAPVEDLEKANTLRQQIEALVRRDLCARYVLTDVAKQLALSTRSLQRQLQSERVSFSEVVDACRVREASRLLRQTDLSITEIGFTCGFSDAAHFSRRFKLRYSETPTAYRQHHQPP